MELQLKKNLLDFKIKKSQLAFNMLMLTLSISIFSNFSFADKKIYSCNDQNGDMVFTDSPENDPNCINPKEKNYPQLLLLPV